MKFFPLFFLSFFLILSCNNSTSTTGTESLTDTLENGKDTSRKDLEVPLLTEIFDWDRIQSRGTLKVIVLNGATSYFLYKGEPLGFEYEMAAHFCKKNKIKMELVIAKNIEEAIHFLESGKGDIIANGLTVGKERSERIQFSSRVYSTHQVLIQAKPDNWKRMYPPTLESRLLRDPLDLEGDTVWVRYASIFKNRLENLTDEIGGEIFIVEAPDSLITEDLVHMVSEGKIKYTVADDNFSQLAISAYPNLDNKTSLSFNQKVAWAIRKDHPLLLEKVNQWLAKARRDGTKNVLYAKYFKHPQKIVDLIEDDYGVVKEGKISPYDDLIRENAKRLDWDWRLLAALIFKESRFNPKARSWVGARGLMQLMPRTGRSYGVTNPFDPVQNIKGGTSHLLWLSDYWKEKVMDPEERKKFVIGSYNVGQGHVLDAQRLAEKYGGNPMQWKDVAFYLLKKSKAKYYFDPVVKHGYCRGIEVTTYVSTILEIYHQYQVMIPENN